MSSDRNSDPPTHMRIRDHWTDKAEAWHAQADAMAPLADRFNRPLMEAIGLEAGHSLLDLASGAGEPAFTAEKIVGETGMVVATDLVPAMLTGLRRRDREKRLRFVAADMQKLPFADGAFDRVTCRFGIMFPPDVDTALSETRRVLKPGGRVGFMVWPPEPLQTLFHVLAEAVDFCLGEARDDHFHRMFRFSEPGSLTTAMAVAGYGDMTERDLSFTPRAPADRPFWRPQLHMTFGDRVHGVDEAVLDRLDKEIKERLEPLRDGGSYQLHTTIRIVTGTR
ncbi:class I SAM-dependent methyltransferase [Rhodospirillaceae bacterium KN72]|uniref:Class I SAM-dependent methyltransferase n=1 Tax=Pacificispira spongiicola TaxID=2729598 RepID=A0A7Y0E0C0_9PROT|nr:class I SAM-dependent methyltransferase [Pacificispira spongiicola]NMM44131.1 class I SAM-dependent methyltransferase [Pacificispira spongiicola]